MENNYSLRDGPHCLPWPLGHGPKYMYATPPATAATACKARDTIHLPCKSVRSVRTRGGQTSPRRSRVVVEVVEFSRTGTCSSATPSLGREAACCGRCSHRVRVWSRRGAFPQLLWAMHTRMQPPSVALVPLPSPATIGSAAAVLPEAVHRKRL